jgi:hypothetical protein
MLEKPLNWASILLNLLKCNGRYELKCEQVCEKVKDRNLLMIYIEINCVNE